jgi:hypothetical protein
MFTVIKRWYSLLRTVYRSIERWASARISSRVSAPVRWRICSRFHLVEAKGRKAEQSSTRHTELHVPLELSPAASSVSSDSTSYRFQTEARRGQCPAGGGREARQRR